MKIRSAGLVANAVVLLTFVTMFLTTETGIAAVTPTTIECPPNVFTNAAPSECAQTVSFAAIAGGATMPSVRYRIGDVAIGSPHAFPVGVTTVIATASNATGTATCSFTVAVLESIPPEISCPSDVFATTLPGEASAVVEFNAPAATDNCGAVVVVCEPPSGSQFPVGTTPVNCTATDLSGNTSRCTFFVIVEATPSETHDLAITKITAPRLVRLTERRPSLTKRVVVTVQNRSDHTESFVDPVQLASLVTLEVQSLDSNLCADITPVFIERRPQRRLPFNLKSKAKLNVYFDVTFDCAVQPKKGTGLADFRYVATVHHEAIDGVPDTHPECDVCPRLPLEGGVDPNPNGKIRDNGCGARRGDGTYGNDVLTDVLVR